MIHLKNDIIICLIDLELVASEGSLKNRWHRPTDFPEIIEIGVLKVIYKDGKFEELDELLVVVKPKIHKKIPNYILKLTNHNEEYFSNGISLKEALKKMTNFCLNANYNFSNGVDGEIIKLNKIKLNIKSLTPEIYNFREFLASDPKKGLINTHNALEDCRVMLRKLNHIATKKKITSFQETTFNPLVRKLVLNYGKNN